MSLPIALQLYTVRDALKGDLEGTLKAISTIGFENVEIAGFYNKTPGEFRQLLEKNNLKPISMHANLTDSSTNLDQTIRNAKELGVNYVVCSYLSVPEREDYDKVARLLAEGAYKAAQQGITLAYHNHSFEFVKDAQGRRGLDVIFDTNSGSKLNAELDIYWVQHGGDNPVDWMKKLAGRIPLLHVKDMANTPERGFAEVGTGTVDIKAAVHAAPQVGVKYLIVEQDSHWKGSPLESVKISLTNLKAIIASL